MLTAPDPRCRAIAQQVVALARPALIAVDGVDGSGKTTFAAQLAAAIEEAGRPAVVVHEDDFLAPRAVRYRLGQDSPEGFFRDSYDLDGLVRHVLVTMEQVPAEAVVIVEGLFLHRDELSDRWDWSVFLDVPFEESVRRMAQRDGSHPDPAHPTMRRYVEGQRIYLESCRPLARAAVVLDNS